MTKLQPVVQMTDYYDGQPLSLEEEIQLDLRKNGHLQARVSSDGDMRNDLNGDKCEIASGNDGDGYNQDDNDEDNRAGVTIDQVHSEPLGYHNFLCDVHIEYNPGGNRPSLTDNHHCFKMKCLPYMIQRDCCGTNINKDSHSETPTDNEYELDSQTGSLHHQMANSESKYVDVFKTTCAFLGNSEYVPNIQNKRRHVVLEMISAKLSQPSHYLTPDSSSTSNLFDLIEDPEQQQKICSTERLPSNAPNSPSASKTQISSPASPVSSSNSKKFVNYRILIKTAPGLDRQPAVIERRFSDFLQLYQGLKSHVVGNKLVDEYVSFPKKVFMGNFSLVKIAERSIEFTRLLSLCMTRKPLLWSAPFVSFLIDKELKNAHRLSLFGDPDDVQALIETAYFIVRKLYINHAQPQLGAIDPPSSLNSSAGSNRGRHSPITPNEGSLVPQSPSNETISAASNLSNASRLANSTNTNSNNSADGLGAANTDELGPSSPNYSMCDTIEDFSFALDRTDLSSLNQRILVTYCTLFVVYCRGKQYTELKRAIREFNRLISSQEYVESLVNTRHYTSLRACLLFLMNLTRGNVIDESTRLWLKARLEDIDGTHAELDDSMGSSRTQRTSDSGLSADVSATRYQNGDGDTVNGKGTNRVTKKDLTSLLRDRNFCSFNDAKPALW